MGNRGSTRVKLVLSSFQLKLIEASGAVRTCKMNSKTCVTMGGARREGSFGIKGIGKWVSPLLFLRNDDALSTRMTHSRDYPCTQILMALMAFAVV